MIRALVAGYGFTLRHPDQAAAELEAEVPGLDPSLVSSELSALLPVFRGRAGRVGELDRSTLERWSAWEARFGIVRRPPDVAATFDPGFVSESAGG